jgi:hypothetical protein
MPTVDERADEILNEEVDEDLVAEFIGLLESFPTTTAALLAIEEYLQTNGDEKGYRIVEQCTLKMAVHEAETG